MRETSENHFEKTTQLNVTTDVKLVCIIFKHLEVILQTMVDYTHIVKKYSNDQPGK